MSGLTEAKPSALPDREERALAKLARIARCDVYFGGAKALVLANRLERMGSTAPFESVVAESYAASYGDATSYLAYECPECGCACMGEDSAYSCCGFESAD